MQKGYASIIGALFGVVVINAVIVGYVHSSLQSQILAIGKKEASLTNVSPHGQSASVTLQAPNPDEKALQKYKRAGFNDVVMKYAREYSDCYKVYLGEDDKGVAVEKRPEGFIREGVMTFVFHVAEDGRMLSYNLVKDDFKQDDFEKCIHKNFSDLHFLPPPLGINRYIAHDLSFKTEETYKRELEERKNQSLPKVLPVSPDE